jgi:nickel-type superoxide dismutase maturation protease
MIPTLRAGDYVIVNKLSYLFKKPSRGDIIVFRHPENGRFLIKRIAEVEDSEYFVLGDNKEFSTDSRHFGAINKNLVVGKVWLQAKQ